MQNKNIEILNKKLKKNTFVVESINSIDRSTFMISSE